MTEQYCNVLYKKYNVLGHFQFKQFDSNWIQFESYLESIKKNVYEHHDRYIIEHQDTDYYILNDFPYGFWLYNLINVFKNLDIPLYTILLYTNHFGISKEIDRLAPDINDRPTVIETFITNTHYSNSYVDTPVEIDDIEIPAICMMGGTKRVHRFALFRFFEKYNLLDRIATSI
jgi:hypothetical protein